MEKRIYDKKTGIRYELQGDYIWFVDSDDIVVYICFV